MPPLSFEGVMTESEGALAVPVPVGTGLKTPPQADPPLTSRVGSPSAGVGSARRAAIGSLPGTEKGRRMRSQLLSAAREVFERDGYLNARVADIAAAAGASHGSFYTYFESKTEIFRSLVGEELQRLYTMLGSDPQVPTTGRGIPEPSMPRRSVEEIVAGIERANLRFVAMYQQNAALLGLFEQVTSFDPEVRALRMQVRRRMVDRVAASIRRIQAEGLVSTDLEAHYTASILVSMANGIVHHWLVVGEDFDGEVLIHTLNQLWVGALGLPRDAQDGRTAKAT